MSSVDFAYSMMYSVLVKLVDPFSLFWPDLTLTFTAIHLITEGRIMYYDAFTLVNCVFLLKRAR